jgi:hypothetical protein
MRWRKVNKTDKVPSEPMWVSDGLRVELYLERLKPPMPLESVEYYMLLSESAPYLPRFMRCRICQNICPIHIAIENEMGDLRHFCSIACLAEQIKSLGY